MIPDEPLAGCRRNGIAESQGTPPAIGGVTAERERHGARTGQNQYSPDTARSRGALLARPLCQQNEPTSPANSSCARSA